MAGERAAARELLAHLRAVFPRAAAGLSRPRPPRPKRICLSPRPLRGPAPLRPARAGAGGAAGGTAAAGKEEGGAHTVEQQVAELRRARGLLSDPAGYAGRRAWRVCGLSPERRGGGAAAECGGRSVADHHTGARVAPDGNGSHGPEGDEAEEGSLAGGGGAAACRCGGVAAVEALLGDPGWRHAARPLRDLDLSDDPRAAEAAGGGWRCPRREFERLVGARGAGAGAGAGGQGQWPFARSVEELVAQLHALPRVGRARAARSRPASRQGAPARGALARNSAPAGAPWWESVAHTTGAGPPREWLGGLEGLLEGSRASLSASRASLSHVSAHGADAAPELNPKRDPKRDPEPDPEPDHADQAHADRAHADRAHAPLVPDGEELRRVLAAHGGQRPSHSRARAGAGRPRGGADALADALAGGAACVLCAGRVAHEERVARAAALKRLRCRAGSSVSGSEGPAGSQGHGPRRLTARLARVLARTAGLTAHVHAGAPVLVV